MAKKKENKTWLPVDGEEPGVEYEMSEGHATVRVWEDGGFRYHGPAKLIGGSAQATVRQLLREMRAKEQGAPHG